MERIPAVTGGDDPVILDIDAVAGGDPLGEQRRHRPQFQRGGVEYLCEVSER